ncbi:MAG: LCP family protein, partial [Actinomycetia bacterium]|nr:LCP family protein [Actinomycetes bacterium]
MGNQPLVAALLSALIPGAGQLYARRPVRAVAFFLPIAVLAGGAAFGVSSLGKLGVAQLLVQPDVLSWLLLGNVVILTWRIAASIDAFIVTTTTADRSWMSVTLALLLLALAVPHLIGWSYGIRTINALEAVFVAAPADGGVPAVQIPSSTLPDTLPDPAVDDGPIHVKERSARNYILRDGIGDPDAVASRIDIIAPASPIAPFVPFTERVDPDRVTILLVGGDAGPGREGLRTDSMNVVSVDLDTGQVAMFGLPRNFKLVPLPRRLRNSFVELEKRVIEKDLTDADGDGYPDTWTDADGDGIPEEPAFVSCACFPDMLNKVYKNTRNWTRTYPNSPDPGLSALRDIVSNLLDLHIDYFVMVDMAGFVRAIDAIGGIDVLVQEPYHVMVSSPEEGKPKARVDVDPGMNHLSGPEALAYARWRIGSSDYDRMGRQRCIIRAAATQADTVTLIRAYPRLLDLVEEYVTTDVPLTFLPDLVQIAGSIDYNDIATVGFVPPTYNSGRTPRKYPIPNVERIRWKVRQVLEEGPAAQSKTGISEC